MFGDLVIAYLFLGGAGAGACFVLALLSLRTPSFALSDAGGGKPSWEAASLRPLSSYARLFGRAQAVSLAFLLLGTCCLAADLGRFDRAALLFLQPAPTVLSFGAWSLVACIAVAFVVLLAWHSAFRRLGVRGLRVLFLSQALFALFAMVYTGLLLGSLSAVPLWHGAWLPALFVVSSFSCGLALVCASALLGGSGDEFSLLVHGLMTADAAVIIVEFAVLAGLFACASTAGIPEGSGTEAAIAQSMALLTEGDPSRVFWGVFIGVGMVLPLLLEVGMAIFRAKAPLVAIAACACVLVGGFAMRYCFVVAGVHPAIVTM